MTKVTKPKGVLYRIRKFLSLDARISFHYEIANPNFSYNILMWEIRMKTLWKWKLKF